MIIFFGWVWRGLGRFWILRQQYRKFIVSGSHSNRGISSQEIKNLIACGLDDPSSSKFCDFPGANIYLAIVKFSQLRKEIDEILASPSARGYLTPYNIDTKYFGRPQVSRLRKCFCCNKEC